MDRYNTGLCILNVVLCSTAEVLIECKSWPIVIMRGVVAFCLSLLCLFLCRKGYPGRCLAGDDEGSPD